MTKDAYLHGKDLKDLRAIDLLAHVPLSLRQGLKCMSFARWGGVSNPPFHELNVGELTGDEAANVKANLEMVRKVLGASHVVSVRQVHGTDFLHVKKGTCNLTADQPVRADGIFTTERDVGLMIKHADCQAVVMFDPERCVIANIHCGWRGSVGNILKKAVDEFVEVYGSRAHDIWAGIGPSLGPCCAEFRQWKETFPAWLHGFRKGGDHFDFWKVSKNQLEEAGVPSGQIFCPEICTVCSKDHFSYRREKTTGRLATVIALESGCNQDSIPPAGN